MSVARVEVATEPPYSVWVGPDCSAELASALEDCDRAALLADEYVLELHAASVPGLKALPRLALPRGERAKTLEQLGRALDFLAAAGLSRASLVIALGGGATCDLAGLAASMFKRGCGVVHLPTTLLAQVDASVGGKTAINLAAGKNLAGTFHQPSGVYADTNMLATLPAAEFESGLGEVVKTAWIAGPDDWAELEACAVALREREAAALAGAVARCVALKARIVAEDPNERGPRRALNLGHTFGHAIEQAAGYGRVPHGVAVAVGLMLALQASRELGTLAEPELEERAAALLRQLELPVSLGELRRRESLELPAGRMIAALAHDKKGRVGQPEFVLPTKLGHCALGVPLEPALLGQLLA